MGGRSLSKRASGVAESARSDGAHAVAQGFHVRRRTARTAGAVAVDESARRVGQETAKRFASHLARTLHDVDRDRRRAHSDRSGVGAACVSLRARRTEAFSTGARIASRDAARRCRDRLARSLRSSRLSHHSRPGQDRRAVRHVPRRRRASGILGCAGGTHHRTRLVGVVYAAEYGCCVDGRAIAAFFRARIEGSQFNAVVIACDSLARDTPCSSAEIRV